MPLDDPAYAYVDALQARRVGALAFNPERVLALEERGHRLFGLWTDDGLGAHTVGPLPFGHVTDVLSVEAARALDGSQTNASMFWIGYDAPDNAPWDGDGYEGLDAGNFIRNVYKDLGINLPKDSLEIPFAADPVDLKDVVEGDLIAWDPREGDLRMGENNGATPALGGHWSMSGSSTATVPAAAMARTASSELCSIWSADRPSKSATSAAPPSTASTLSAASTAMAVRVSTVAEPRCGRSTTFSSSSRPGCTCGSSS